MKNRQRGRNNNGKPRPMGGGGGGGRNPNFDGGQRMRGNAQQLMEKYLAMARDASSAGDRVLAENYFQHADHYYRVLNARFEQQQNNNNGNRHQNYNQNGGGNGQNYNQGGFDGDQQSNFNDQPHGQPSHGQQPYHNQHQPQYQQPAQHQPQHQNTPAQPEPAREQPRAVQNHGEDIGLPPGILGIDAAQDAPASEGRPSAPSRADGAEEERGSRQGGRRRRGRGGDRQTQSADAE